MHVLVNGVRLFFDVEGAKLVPDGPAMREKPTLLLLHGGNGRSEDGPPDGWNLAQWGDDVRTFCDVLGIVNPIVLGASFGGMVALAYATRHPGHASKLVLISTEAAGGSYRERRVELFERFGGPEVGALARRRFLELQGHPDQASLDAWRRLAFPLYTRTPRDPDMARRAVSRSEVQRWFTKPDGESGSFNMLPDLGRIQCPTLVLGGEDDPIHPIESQADIAAALPAHLVQFERFPNCGHAVVPDAPERAMAAIRDFIERR
jgi:pimeloyl-ACP methyl ester carboxylesterase